MQTDERLQAYKSHKTVMAAKISSMAENSDGSRILYCFDEDGMIFPIDVSREYSEKHEPKAGGYFVQYSDGYQSWSPPEPFNEGYMLVSEFDQPVTGGAIGSGGAVFGRSNDEQDWESRERAVEFALRQGGNASVKTMLMEAEKIFQFLKEGRLPK